jgi:hypothetical protein
LPSAEIKNQPTNFSLLLPLSIGKIEVRLRPEKNSVQITNQNRIYEFVIRKFVSFRYLYNIKKLKFKITLCAVKEQ